MKRAFTLVMISAAMALLSTGIASAQLGFGVAVGVAAAGDNISQAGGALSDLFHKDSVQYGDLSGNIGFFVTGKARYGLLEIFRLTGDISYVYFQSSAVTLTGQSIDTATHTASATFDVGTSMIPINVGLDVVAPFPVVKPYLGAQLGYTYTSRTYAFVSGSNELNKPEFSNSSAGDPDAGIAFDAGVGFHLGVATIDVNARYNFANLLSKSDGEKSVKYLQLGAGVIF